MPATRKAATASQSAAIGFPAKPEQAGHGACVNVTHRSIALPGRVHAPLPSATDFQ